MGELMPSVPPILARLDLVVYQGTQLAVLDLKTSRARWGSEQLRALAVAQRLIERINQNVLSRLRGRQRTQRDQDAAMKGAAGGNGGLVRANPAAHANLCRDE